MQDVFFAMRDQSSLSMFTENKGFGEGYVDSRPGV